MTAACALFSQLHEYRHKVITARPSLWVRIWFEIRDVSHQVLLCEEVHLFWRIKMSFSTYSQVKWTALDELPALGTPLCLHCMLASQ